MIEIVLQKKSGNCQQESTSALKTWVTKDMFLTFWTSTSPSTNEQTDCLRLCEQKEAGVLNKSMNDSNFLSLLLLSCICCQLTSNDGGTNDPPS